jgi:hypothetical protein
MDHLASSMPHRHSLANINLKINLASFPSYHVPLEKARA